MRLVLIVVALVACHLSPYSVAYAQNAGLRDHMLEMARGHAQTLDDIESRMRAQSSNEWSETDVQQYLAEALWTVHYSLWAYRFGEGALPDSPEDLKGGEYCPKWPSNPFNSWEPIQALTAMDAFAPGELTYQLCPASFYSFLNDKLQPLSYELGIFAPTMEFSSISDAKPLELNTWSIVPDGTLYMAGVYTETADITAKKLERRKAKKQAEEKKSKAEEEK